MSRSRRQGAFPGAARRGGRGCYASLKPALAGFALAAASVYAAGTSAETSLLLSDAWVRAMPPGQAMTAAYATVSNPGATPVTLRGVSASRGEASLHETRRVDGRVRMRAVDSLTVPAGGELRLEPGGLHVMLMGLDSTPMEGDVLNLCFSTDADMTCVDAPVARRAP